MCRPQQLKEATERQSRFVRQLVQILVHPKFKKERPYDIALLKMDRSVEPF